MATCLYPNLLPDYQEDNPPFVTETEMEFEHSSQNELMPVSNTHIGEKELMPVGYTEDVGDQSIWQLVPHTMWQMI